VLTCVCVLGYYAPGMDTDDSLYDEDFGREEDPNGQVCAKCELSLPLKEFYPSFRNKNGKYCKTCHKRYSRKRARSPFRNLGIKALIRQVKRQVMPAGA
jgi:hypothetical protein